MTPSYMTPEIRFNSDFPFHLRIDRLPFVIPPHGHGFFEFNFTIQGNGIEKINGVEHELKRGTFTMFFPHHIHEIIPNQGDEIVLYVGNIGLEVLFDDNDSIFSFNSLLSGTQDDMSSYYYLDDKTCNEVLKVLEQILNEIDSEKLWSRSMAKLKMAELFIIFNRFRAASNDKAKTLKSVKRKSTMSEIVKYVYQNFSEEISLESLSEKYHLSMPYISSSFKQYTGENFHSFLEKIRIAHACSLLTATELSVIEIALEVGFKSYATFSRVFLSNMKTNPSNYRKRNLYHDHL